MVVTEEEAKTKWCPFVRYGATAAVNRDFQSQYSDRHCHCIGSACMAWRRGPYDHTHNQARGFCGLAGNDGGG